MELVRTIDPFRVTVNGDTVEVDQRTFTLAERRASRVALLAQSNDDDWHPTRPTPSPPWSGPCCAAPTRSSRSRTSARP